MTTSHNKTTPAAQVSVVAQPAPGSNQVTTPAAVFDQPDRQVAAPPRTQAGSQSTLWLGALGIAALVGVGGFIAGTQVGGSSQQQVSGPGGRGQAMQQNGQAGGMMPGGSGTSQSTAQQNGQGTSQGTQMTPPGAQPGATQSQGSAQVGQGSAADQSQPASGQAQ